MALSLARRSCAMLCLFLVLWFAAVQGSNAIDRIQHISMGDAFRDHHHSPLSIVTIDEVQADVDAQAAAPGTGAMGGEEGEHPVHHHHNADHGSSLPAQFLTQNRSSAVSSLHSGIPQVAAVTGMTGTVMERPPKLPAIAA